MTRSIDDPHDDQLVQPAIEPVRFRLVAVEPHGWSTVLIEDNGGRFYIAVTANGSLSEVDPDIAEELILNRSYRRWNGDRMWTELERLPLLDSSFAQHEGTAGSISDDFSL